MCACVLCCVKGKMCTPVTGSVCLDNAVYSRILLSLCWKCCESVGLRVTESMYISVVLRVLLIMCPCGCQCDVCPWDCAFVNKVVCLCSLV